MGSSRWSFARSPAAHLLLHGLLPNRLHTGTGDWGPLGGITLHLISVTGTFTYHISSFHPCCTMKHMGFSVKESKASIPSLPLITNIKNYRWFNQKQNCQGNNLIKTISWTRKNTQIHTHTHTHTQRYQGSWLNVNIVAVSGDQTQAASFWLNLKNHVHTMQMVSLPFIWNPQLWPFRSKNPELSLGIVIFTPTLINTGAKGSKHLKTAKVFQQWPHLILTAGWV